MEENDDSSGTVMDNILGIGGVIIIGIVIYWIVAAVWGLLTSFTGRTTNDIDNQG